MSPLAARLLAVALAVAAVSAAVHADPPPCTAFLQPLIPCTAYITGQGDEMPVPVPCCNGVNIMAGMMTSRTDRVAACKCFKSAADQMRGVDYGRIAALPSRCHVHVQFDFTPGIDCDKIKAAVGSEPKEHL